MKRLYKSRKERVIWGVAGGMAEYFEVDPTLVRLAWVLVAFSGVGVLAYIVASLVIPEAPYTTAPGPHTAREGGEAPAEGQGTAPAAPTEGAVLEWPKDEHRDEPRPKSMASDSRTFGLILVLLGAVLMVRRVIPGVVLNNLWPVALILLGAYLVSQATRGVR
ncbi:MAG: PspC domain-containing protein [Bacillota bacterium]|nr:PspC domain-containing protein [Bacillota bacterium]